MRKPSLMSLAAILVVALANPAGAADTKAAIAACDKVNLDAPGSCNYSVGSNGQIQGCTKNVCFTCWKDSCVGHGTAPGGTYQYVAGLGLLAILKPSRVISRPPGAGPLDSSPGAAPQSPSGMRTPKPAPTGVIR